MSRPMILGLAGALLIVAAIAMTFLVEPKISFPIPGLATEQTPDDKEASSESSDQTASVAPAKPAPAASGARSGPSADNTTTEAAAAGAESPGARPSFDIVRVNPKGDVVIAGRAAPNAEITIRDKETVIGTARADGRGEWVLIPEKPLRPGARELVLSARNKAGQKIDAERRVVIVVPERGKDIAGNAGGDKDQGVLALSVPRTGAGTRVIQRPGDKPASGASGANDTGKADAPVTIDAIDYDETGSVTINGSAAPGASLHIYLDNRLAARGNADARGRWRVVPGKPLPPGSYTLRIDEVDANGKVVQRAEAEFLRPASPAKRDPKAVIRVVRGNSLWRIARNVYGEGTLYTVIYEANKNQIRDPDLIYPGQVFFVPHQDAAR